MRLSSFKSIKIIIIIITTIIIIIIIIIAPLSLLLNASTYGYEAQGKTISHLFYMDDLKTYAKGKSQQTSHSIL